MRSTLTEDKGRGHYSLLLPNFIEAMLRIAIVTFQRKGFKAEPLSVTLENFLKTVVKHDCASLEGFIFADQLHCSDLQNIFDYYQPKLLELYDKLKISEWGAFESTHYSCFGKISFNGIIPPYLSSLLLEFFTFLRKNYMLDMGIAATQDKRRDLTRTLIRSNSRSNTLPSQKSFGCFGRKIFGDAIDFTGRTTEFGITTVKAMELLLACLQVVFNADIVRYIKNIGQ